MKTSLCTVFGLLLVFVTHAQNDTTEYVDYTFKTTRVISGHSIETLPKGVLDIRIGHRFGDIGGDDNDNRFFGFDNSSDILMATEYGISDRFTLGSGRTKGAGEIKELYHLSGKYRALRQTTNGVPFSITLLTNGAISAQEKNVNSPNDISFFPDSGDRLTYLFQGIIGRKFNKDLSLQVMPTYVLRNRVQQFDEEGLFVLGGSGRLKFSKRFGLIVEYFRPFSDFRNDDAYRVANNITEEYYDPLGVGLEIETGGHVFHLNFSNSSALLENDFLPYSEKNWGDGEFRFGFTISRVFQLN